MVCGAGLDDVGAPVCHTRKIPAASRTSRRAKHQLQRVPPSVWLCPSHPQRHAMSSALFTNIRSLGDSESEEGVGFTGGSAACFTRHVSVCVRKTRPIGHLGDTRAWHVPTLGGPLRSLLLPRCDKRTWSIGGFWAPDRGPRQSNCVSAPPGPLQFETIRPALALSFTRGIVCCQ